MDEKAQLSVLGGTQVLISNIKKSYGNKAVLKDINLQIADKEFLVVLGSSGSGKSTLLKIIAGIEQADGGEIVLDGTRIDLIDMQRRNVGYLFQEPLLFPHMNVRQNITYSLVMNKKNKKEIEEKYCYYTKLLQIEELGDRMPSELSGGQKQRVSLARAIINSPKMLLMDEPFSSLDYNLRVQLGEMLLKLKKQLDLTIVFVTHDISESLLLGDRIAFLHDGSLLEIKTPQEMYYNPTFEETAKFMGDYNTIVGTVCDNVFESKYGLIPAEFLPEVADKIFVRPNKIRLSHSFNGDYIVDRIISRGKEIRITIKNEPLIIDTYFLNNLKEGDKVDLKFEA